MSLLELDRVTKRYRDGAKVVTVLDAVRLELDAGETVGVAGDRRSGKSTLLRIAAGFERPDAGLVRFRGRPLSVGASERASLSRREGIALVQGDWRPRGDAPALELVRMPLLADGIASAQANHSAKRALDLVGASAYAQTPIGMLSIAERIRIDLARAVASEPRVLLVDEPAVLRGPNDSRALFALLRDLPARIGVALLIASEDLAAVAGLPRVLALADGRLVSSREGSAEVIELPSARPRSGSESA